MLQAEYERAILDDLRQSALRPVILGTLILSLAPLLEIVTSQGMPRVASLVISACLVVTWWLTSLAVPLGARPAGLVLIVGLTGTIVLAAYLYASAILLLGLSLVVAAAVVLLGAWLGVAVAAASTIWIVSSSSWPATSLEFPRALVTLLWGSLVVSWMLWRPARTMLDWSWQHYLQSQGKINELRERQIELGRLNRSLNDAYSQLGQLTRDLDAARRAAEEARWIKAEFAANISHELRTPLNLIIGFSEMLVLRPHVRTFGALADTSRGDLEAIYRNACHLAGLIDDVLDLSQVEAHRIGLKRAPTALRQVVDEAAMAVETMFHEKGLTLEIEMPTGLPTMLIDRVRIRQVLINLLSNAVRFTDRGGVIVRTRLDEREIVVSVADTGTGIPIEEIPEVFEAFHQVGPQGGRRHSGLGLTIAKRFTELHGGNIWVESVYGSGTTFHFSLPRAEAVISLPPERDWDRLARAVGQDGHAHQTIAILDDDPEVLRLFQRYLDEYRIVSETDEKQLADAVQAGAIRAVVMTRANAEARAEYSVQRHRQDWQSPNLPIIWCPLRVTRDVAAELGVAGYLHKPVARDQLRDALRQFGHPISDALVVDDEPDMQRLLAQMVKVEFPRARVAMAKDGHEALERLQDKRPDMMLLDLLMPGLDGYEVLRQLKADERLSDVPVVVVTARAAEADAVLVSGFEVTRPAGLMVGEVMKCLQNCLSALLEPVIIDSHRGQPAVPLE